MLDYQIQTPDGTALTGWNFGDVAPGILSDALPFQIVNTGTVAITSLLAWVEQASVDDGEMRVTIGSVLLTGTTLATAEDLGALEVGAALMGEVRWRNPADGVGVPVDTGTLRLRAV